MEEKIELNVGEEKITSFLPIGTIVKLKKGEIPMMITSYCVFAKTDAEVITKDGKMSAAPSEIFEYGSCPFPIGILDSNMNNLFNTSDIEKVIYKGYETEESKKIVADMKKVLDTFKEEQKKNAAN